MKWGGGGGVCETCGNQPQQQYLSDAPVCKYKMYILILLTVSVVHTRATYLHAFVSRLNPSPVMTPPPSRPDEH